MIVIAVIAALSLPFARVHLPNAAPFASTMIFTATLADIATFAILFALLRERPRKSIAVLVIAYASASLLSLAYISALPEEGARWPILFSGSNVAPYVYALWHLVFSLCTFGYARGRASKHDALEPSELRPFVVRYALIVGGFTIFGLAFVVRFSESLPRLIDGTSLAGFRESGIGFALLGVGAVSFITIWRIQSADLVDRFLALTLFAITVDVLLNLVGAERYSLSWYLSRFLYFWASQFVMLGAVVQLLVTYRGYGALQLTLSGQERRARRQTKRLDALWHMSLTASRHQRGALAAILSEGAASMRTDQPFFAVLARLDGDRVVVEAKEVGDPATAEAFTGLLDDRPLAESSICRLLVDGATHVWNDLAAEIASPVPWRAIVGTSFRIGARQYFVVLGSREPALEDFGAEDAAFVEVIARMCFAHLSDQATRERLLFQDEHDALTNLHNRKYFRSQIVRGLAAGRGVAAVVDIDGFAEINRSLGQMAGDAVLVEFGAALKSVAAPGETVARLGDDKFGIVIPLTSALDVAARIEAYSAVVNRSMNLGDRAGTAFLDMHARIGVARYPEDGSDVEAIMARAISAVDAARACGPRGIAYFDACVEATFAERRELLADLRQAIVRDEFVVHYQPKIDMRDGSVFGAEALVRWHHPRRGLLLPESFISFAEEQGLVGAIDERVLAHAIGDLVDLAQGNERFRCYVNIATDQMGDLAWCASIVSKLGAVHIPTSMLGVEITETMAMQDVEASLQSMCHLRQAGIHVALDDFGTGYSSLAYLKSLPIDVLKIDRSFISGIPREPKDCAIVESMLSIAKNFGFAILAEGVENPISAAWLLERGCYFAQGYLYAKPMPKLEFLAWSARRGSAAVGVM